MIKKITTLLILSIFLFAASGCKKGYQSKNPDLDTRTKITLCIAAPWPECKAMDKLCSMFSEQYPNVTFRYEYLQDYYKSLEVRLAEDNSENQKIDMFLSFNVNDYDLKPYTLELFSNEKYLDLSKTFPGLIENFSIIEKDGTKSLYCVPLGADLRGMFVNKTILNSLSIDTPKNINEFNTACKKLSENGFIPVHGNPGYFAQRLLYPYICNIVANSENSDEIKKKLSTCEEGSSQFFEEPLKVLYSLIANRYYDYKYVENELSMFKDSSDEGIARSFFDIVNNGEEYEKSSDLGRAPFLAGASSQINVFDTIKEDYHSHIDYEFIMAPLGEKGGYAYLSPTHGIAISKKSQFTDYALEFLNFLFQPENNKIFAEEFHCIANTKDAFEVTQKNYQVPDDSISELGQVTFSYGFYALMNESLVEISKGNNPKYMNTDEDGNTVIFDFSYYLKRLEERFAAKREELKK